MYVMRIETNKKRYKRYPKTFLVLVQLQKPLLRSYCLAYKSLGLLKYTADHTLKSRDIENVRGKKVAKNVINIFMDKFRIFSIILIFAQ